MRVVLRDGLTRLLVAHDFEVVAAADTGPTLRHALVPTDRRLRWWMSPPVAPPWTRVLAVLAHLNGQG